MARYEYRRHALTRHQIRNYPTSITRCVMVMTQSVEDPYGPAWLIYLIWYLNKSYLNLVILVEPHYGDYNTSYLWIEVQLHTWLSIVFYISLLNSNLRAFLLLLKIYENSQLVGFFPNLYNNIFITNGQTLVMINSEQLTTITKKTLTSITN